MSHPKSFFKILIFSIFFLFFAVLAYFAYQFISEAERSAAGIEQPDFNKSNDLDFSKFDYTIPLPSNRTLPELREQGGDLNSSGNDVAIKAGEFAYVNGQPLVKIALQNRSHFTISAVSVSLSLLLDDVKEPAASEVGIPIALTQPLLPNEEVVISVPVSGGEWQGEMVRAAQSRRVLAQIIAVSDADQQNVEYPQTGKSVYLKQTGNDWRVSSDPLVLEQIEASQVKLPSREPPPDFSDPTAGMDLAAPKPVAAVKIEPVTELKIDKNILEQGLEYPQPTAKPIRQPETAPDAAEEEIPEETGVISYEIKSFQK